MNPVGPQTMQLPYQADPISRCRCTRVMTYEWECLQASGLVHHVRSPTAVASCSPGILYRLKPALLFQPRLARPKRSTLSASGTFWSLWDVGSNRLRLPGHNTIPKMRSWTNFRWLFFRVTHYQAGIQTLHTVKLRSLSDATEDTTDQFTHARNIIQ